MDTHKSNQLFFYTDLICFFCFFWKEEFYSDNNSTKKYSVGIIEMIKL